MGKQKYKIRYAHRHLYLHESDGWTEDLVRSVLQTGDIVYRDKKFELSMTRGISAFNEERLRELSDGVYMGDVRVSEELENYALTYCSSEGVFLLGDHIL